MKGPGVEEPVDPLPNGQLAEGVLPGHRLRAAHGERPLASSLEVLDQILHAHVQPLTTVARYVAIPVSGGEPLMSVIMVAISLR